MAAYSEECELQRFDDNEGKFGLQNAFLYGECVVVCHLAH